ncbi:MAG TPA: CAP domain-containing protein [Gemmatimonadaceae bacterium]|nr:CAP domain-containing protein [Gemmatimonadaceae bacterium]
MARIWRRRAGLLVVLFASLTQGVAAQRVPPATPRPAGDSDYVRLEQDVVTALNRARTDPVGFSKDLEGLLPAYHDNVLEFPGSFASIRTLEGDSALREAIRVMRAAKPVPAIRVDPALSRAAQDLVRDQGVSGLFGHDASDASAPEDRLERYGLLTGTLAEDLSYAPVGLSGLQRIEGLLIDDGIADRGHRKNLLNPDLHVAGVACGPHPRSGSLCVIELAYKFSRWGMP